MKTVTFQVIEGIDKGRVYRDLPLPVSIGREEGNRLRLNDERVSRYHAKIQFDNGDVIVTDLDSTNGTSINGTPIQIRRILPGDRVGIGRSVLMFGSNEEIQARITAQKPAEDHTINAQQKTLANDGISLPPDFDIGDDLGARFLLDAEHRKPPLPLKLSPSQAARMAEILDFLHRGLASATAALKANEAGDSITLLFGEWQKVQAVQMLLGHYLRAVAEPEPQT